MKAVFKLGITQPIFLSQSNARLGLLKKPLLLVNCWKVQRKYKLS